VSAAFACWHARVAHHSAYCAAVLCCTALMYLGCRLPYFAAESAGSSPTLSSMSWPGGLSVPALPLPRCLTGVVELAGVAPPAPPTQPSFTVSSVSGQQASSASPFASPAALTFPLAAGTTAGQQLQPPMLLWPLQARQQHEAAVMAAAALPFSSMQFGATQVAAAAPLVSLGSPAARTGTPQQLPNFWPALGTAAPQQTPAVAPAVASCLPQLPCSPQAVWGQVAPQPPLLQPAISRASVSIPPANRANSLAGMFLPPFDLPTSPSVDLIDEVMLDWIGGLDSNARGAGGINLTT